MDVNIKNTDIHHILAGLKLLESDRTTAGEWAVARRVGKLNTELHKQVFDFEKQENQWQ